MKKAKIQKIIGELELMAAAAEPGVVMTEEMSVICCSVLLNAVKQLKDDLNG
jgi:hypothetical protein